MFFCVLMSPACHALDERKLPLSPFQVGTPPFPNLTVFLSPVTCRNAHPIKRVDQSGALPSLSIFRAGVPRIPHQAQEHTSELAVFQEHDLSGARVSRLFRSCRFHDQYFDQLKHGGVAAKSPSLSSIMLLGMKSLATSLLRLHTETLVNINTIERQLVLLPFLLKHSCK